MQKKMSIQQQTKKVSYLEHNELSVTRFQMATKKLSHLETAVNVLKPYKYSFVRIDLMGWPIFAFWPYQIRTHHRMKKISPQELFLRPVCSYVHREQLRRLDGISWNCVAYATISHIFSDAQLLVLLFPSFYQLFIIHFCRRLCRHQQLRLES